MNRATRWIFVGAMLAASVATASAQQRGTRLRGTIEKVDGNVLTLKAAGGAALKLALTADARVVVVLKASMADIKPGTFLGSAAMPQPDGTQKALEVHIFPEEMRGTGEGHRPYAPVPKSTMTNGTAVTVAGINGSVMTVKYKGGEQKITVPSGVPIVRYEIGNRGDLKAGTHFTVLSAVKKPDGTFEANRINVGRDGVVPN